MARKQKKEEVQEFTYTFLEFYQVWAMRNGWVVPDIHRTIIEFLEDENWEQLTKVLLVWRGVGKSTLLDLWVAFKLSINPSLRFVVVSANHNTAKKATQDALSIIRRHPFCEHLIAHDLESRVDSFFVRGHHDNRNPSFKAFGVTSTATGGRADYVIFDDVEVAKNSGTDGKREKLRRAVSEYNHILTPEYGFKLFIGTYHDEISVYDEQIRNGASSLRVPVLKDYSGEYPYIQGTSNWPERFDELLIADRQRNSTRAEFYSQYLLIPSSITESRLDASLIKPYTDEIEYQSSNGHVIASIGKHEIVGVSCFWDPALSEGISDDSVLAIVFSGIDGQRFIHRTVKLKGDADQQCMLVKQIALDLHIPLVQIETNGIGAMLPRILMKHLNGTGIGVKGIAQRTNKNIKILEQLETALYSGRLYAHESVQAGKFPSQVRDFDPSSQKIKDDYIDSVASAIQSEPVRITMTTSSTNRINNWVQSGPVEFEREAFQL